MSNAKNWHTIDRAQFSWAPSINSETCTGCGLCLLSCGNGVFGWNEKDSMPIVQNPGSCVLGCTTCGKLCPENSITFPEDPKKFIMSLITKYKIYPTVKKELEERLAKFPDHEIKGGKNGSI
ncbi:MAG: 4Fe-4S binding protein [Thermoplasmata archaeon]